MVHSEIKKLGIFSVFAKLESANHLCIQQPQIHLFWHRKQKNYIHIIVDKQDLVSDYCCRSSTCGRKGHLILTSRCDKILSSIPTQVEFLATSVLQVQLGLF